MVTVDDVRLWVILQAVQAGDIRSLNGAVAGVHIFVADIRPETTAQMDGRVL